MLDITQNVSFFSEYETITTTSDLSWASFNALALRLQFDSLHVRANWKVNASAQLTQTKTYAMRYYTTTVCII